MTAAMTAAGVVGGTPEHRSLVARTLQIEPGAWRAALEDYARTVPPAPREEDAEAEIDRCLPALAAAYRLRSVHEAPMPGPTPPRLCPACGAEAVRPLIVRRSSPPGREPDLLYGRCTACGHGLLLDGGAPDAARVRARYAGRGYFRARDAQGAGYDGYEAEAAYREGKGARLVDRLRALAPPGPATLLEVGSGYGYARAAAERTGIRTAGVDVNADACAEAARRYGLATFSGTLAEALDANGSGIGRRAFEAVLYQFVLEHVADPIAELGHACEALAPGGLLILLVPGMEAAEIDVFGASYRSFRADHLHLWSRASLAVALARAGFEPARVESSCNIHLLADVLSPGALVRLYEMGRGPDLFVLARSPR